MTEHFIPNGTGLIHCLHSNGSNNLLILMVPGMFGAAEDCIEEFAQLKEYPIAAISLRGRGKSSSNFANYSFESHVTDIKVATDFFKGKKIILFAHSFGCLVSIAAASNIPNQIVGLILVDKGLSQSPLTQSWFDRIQKTPPPHSSLDVARRVYEDVKPVDLVQTFSEIKIPKLIFKGALKGSAISTAEAEVISNIENTKLVTLNKSAHWPSPEDYPLFIAEIKTFVSALSPQS